MSVGTCLRGATGDTLSTLLTIASARTQRAIRSSKNVTENSNTAPQMSPCTTSRSEFLEVFLYSRRSDCSPESHGSSFERYASSKGRFSEWRSAETRLQYRISNVFRRLELLCSRQILLQRPTGPDLHLVPRSSGARCGSRNAKNCQTRQSPCLRTSSKTPQSVHQTGTPSHLSFPKNAFLSPD